MLLGMSYWYLDDRYHDIKLLQNKLIPPAHCKTKPSKLIDPTTSSMCTIDTSMLCTKFQRLLIAKTYKFSIKRDSNLCKELDIITPWLVVPDHRAGLNRRVPMGRYTQIMGGSLRQGLNSKVVTFSTRCTVQPLSLNKSNKEKSKMAASYFCILPSDWPNGYTPLFRFSSTYQIVFKT